MASIYYTASAAVWCEWCECGTSATSTSCTWTHWTSCEGLVSTATCGPWCAWTTQTSACGSCGMRAYPVRQMSDAERAAAAEERAKREEAARIAAEKAAKEAEAAKRRAEKLLHEFLNAEQKKQYAESRAFDITGADGERYRIRDKWAGHVERLKDGKPVERFCIHPDRQVPIPDNQLIAKLMLETDPTGFRRIANATALQPV